jgi:serine/threonine protein kinase/Flp pilus assembly protein TadD
LFLRPHIKIESALHAQTNGAIVNNQTKACFDQKTFRRFLDQESGDTEEAKIIAHLDSCKSCQATLEKLAGQEKDWNEIQTQLVDHGGGSATEQTEGIETRDRQRDLKKVQAMLAPTDDPSMMGRLGGYEIFGVIGRGSAGIVVKALDTRLNRYVAIKLLAPAYANNGCSRRRFEREGRAIASVKNQHVVPIHAVDEFQGTPYIVMQYIPDGSLDQRLRSHGPLNTKEVACIGMQVARGLAAAHERGIIHRDVKPANVLLENGIDGAMVSDFGLARVVDEATMTHSGSISGTPQYMSPEQAKGERADPRSDLFSLGSVMYAACTGHAPFKSESVFGVIKKVCDSEPQPIREINPDIAPWLSALIAKLHSKNPQDRFDSADDVSALLSQELAHIQAPTMVPKPKRDWWENQNERADSPIWKIGLGMAIGAALILAGVVSWNTFFNPAEPGGLGGSTPTTSFAGTNGQLDPNSLLALLKQENAERFEFENTIESTIDVQDGGMLFLRSNLGAVEIDTHVKPSVEMKLVHTVSAEEEAIAKEIFRAIKIDYAADSEAAADANLKKEKDAAIVVKFPFREQMQKKIEESKELDDELKERLLILNNSHYSNAKFRLLVPENFNIDVETSAGPISLADINGTAKLSSHGGRIETGSVSGETEIISHGGHIESTDLGADAILITHGGHIEIGNVDGKLQATSHGGHVNARLVESEAKVETHGGNVRISHAMDTVNAISHGGGITILKAEGPVKAKTEAGTIKVNFFKQPDGDSFLEANAGSVRIGVLNEIAFDIDAQANLGKVRGPFVEENTKTLQYQLNDGTEKLVAVAGTGSVRFQVLNENDFEQLAQQDEAERKQYDEYAEGEAAFQKAYDIHMSGDIDAAILAHQHAATFDGFRGIATFNLGCAWALKSETDKAIAALQDAVAFGFDDLDDYKDDSDLDSLRQDPRFKELITEIGGGDRRERNVPKAPRRPEKPESPSVPEHEGSINHEANHDVAIIISRGESKFDDGNLGAAEELFRSAVKLDPESGLGALMLGTVLHTQNDLDEAYQWHLATSKSEEFRNLGFYNMACVHALKDESDLAFEFLEKSIDAGFDDAFHIRTDADLTSLREDARFSKLLEKVVDANTCEECEEDGECEGDCECEESCESKKCEEAESDEIGDTSGNA